MIYLDNAATSYPKPQGVIDAVNDCLVKVGASPGRGHYRSALQAGRLVLSTRKAVAKLMGARNPADIVFTGNATEALNLALKGWVRPGDTVVTTSIEHNSVCRPLVYLATHRGARIRKAPNKPDGALDLDEFARLVTPDVRLVVVTHGSNVIGNVSPLEKIVEITKQVKTPVLVDATQTLGFLPINVTDSGIGMLAFTGHKALLGPQGTGGLYINPDLAIAELKQGGTGSESKQAQPAVRPDKYESGTLNTPGLAGLGAGVRFVLEKKVETIYQEESRKILKLLDGLSAIKGLTIYGPSLGRERLPLVSFRLAGLAPQGLASILDKNYGIACRAGFHCAPEAHRVIATYGTGTVRFSPGYFTTDDEIDAAIHAVKETAKRAL